MHGASYLETLDSDVQDGRMLKGQRTSSIGSAAAELGCSTRQLQLAGHLGAVSRALRSLLLKHTRLVCKAWFDGLAKTMVSCG